MLSTDFVHGGPVWVDLGSPDVHAGVEFYRSVFGWDPVSAGPEAGGYGFFQRGGRTVAAFGPLMEPGAAPSWTVFFGAEDVDTAAKTVEQAGGAVRMPPTDVMQEGRMGQFTDPTGARFALWQPGRTRGLGAVNEPGTLCWIELHAADARAATAFYDTLFGWRRQEIPLEGGFTYTTLSTGGEQQTFGGLMGAMPGESSGWRPYFEVADCDATVARVSELGGTVVHPAASMAGVGRMAALADPQGAHFSVITSEPMPQG